MSLETYALLNRLRAARMSIEMSSSGERRQMLVNHDRSKRFVKYSKHLENLTCHCILIVRIDARSHSDPSTADTTYPPM